LPLRAAFGFCLVVCLVFLRAMFLYTERHD
jgi:hypothetical protein